MIDRRAFENWTARTEWGQMFLRYAQQGPQGLMRPRAGEVSASASTQVH
jgi:hypothetical protein